MPFPVDNIRKACANKKTTLKQLEKDLRIGNGVIARWEDAKGSPPYDRLVAIANYLKVPVSELTGEEQKNNPSPDGNGLTPVQKEAWNVLSKMSDDQLEQFIRVAKAMFNI